LDDQLEGWAPWAKGRAFAPYYYDLQTVVRWSKSRETYTGFLGTKDRPLEKPASADWFFRPGLTWPRRTNGFSLSILPRGCVFGNKGPAMFSGSNDERSLFATLALANSIIFRHLLSLQVARTELAQSFEVGLLQATPLPDLTVELQETLHKLAHQTWSLKRKIDTLNETSHAFVLPDDLRARTFDLARADIEREIECIQRKIDTLAFDAYGFGAHEQVTFKDSTTGTASNLDIGETDGSITENEDAGEEDDDSEVAKSLLSMRSWLVGVAFGRFDHRLATGERPIPPEPEPFDSLPARSPGMWPEGEVRAVQPPDVMVDDPGHVADIHAHVTSAAARAGLPEPEDLRPWLAREFFALHIKMYSKSRRKAPIYWQLATPSASYSVWLYIHAFTNDTLFRVQNDYVAPKVAHEERRLESMRHELREKATAAERKALATQEAFVEELRAFLDEVKRVAPLWRPNLDDGVIINFAPLWRLVPQHKAWQKELKATWDALCEGKYDWAHLAMHLWPERVVPTCATDRSFAIAHGLEDVFWVEGEGGKWAARKTPTRDLGELVRERTSPALKSALKSLRDAPGPVGAAKKPRKGKAHA
jgi:hypothetical protein